MQKLALALKIVFKSIFCLTSKKHVQIIHGRAKAKKIIEQINSEFSIIFVNNILSQIIEENK